MLLDFLWLELIRIPISLLGPPLFSSSSYLFLFVNICTVFASLSSHLLIKAHSRQEKSSFAVASSLLTSYCMVKQTKTVRWGLPKKCLLLNVLLQCFLMNMTHLTSMLTERGESLFFILFVFLQIHNCPPLFSSWLLAAKTS